MNTPYKDYNASSAESPMGARGERIIDVKYETKSKPERSRVKPVSKVPFGNNARWSEGRTLLLSKDKKKNKTDGKEEDADWDEHDRIRMETEEEELRRINVVGRYRLSVTLTLF